MGGRAPSDPQLSRSSPHCGPPHPCPPHPLHCARPAPRDRRLCSPDRPASWPAPAPRRPPPPTSPASPTRRLLARPAAGWPSSSGWAPGCGTTCSRWHTTSRRTACTCTSAPCAAVSAPAMQLAWVLRWSYRLSSGGPPAADRIISLLPLALPALPLALPAAQQRFSCLLTCWCPWSSPPRHPFTSLPAGQGTERGALLAAAGSVFHHVVLYVKRGEEVRPCAGCRCCGCFRRPCRCRCRQSRPAAAAVTHAAPAAATAAAAAAGCRYWLPPP